MDRSPGNKTETKGQIDERRNRWTDGQISRQLDREINGEMDGKLTDERTDGWIDEETYRKQIDR